MRNEMHICLKWLCRLIPYSPFFLAGNRNASTFFKAEKDEGRSQADEPLRYISLRIPWEYVPEPGIPKSTS
jgi:hypothetical protein